MGIRGAFKQLIKNQGNVFTMLLGGIALTALLSFAIFQTISGPIKTMVKVTNDTMTDVQIHTSTRGMVMNLVNNDTADCDSDGSLEFPVWRDPSGANAPTNGGLIPTDQGVPTTDVWGSDFGYCVWDVGSTSDDAACGGPSANRLDGTNDATTGNYETQTAIAVISAGPNRQFETTCNAYVDGTTDLISKAATSDDRVYRFSHEEVAAAVGQGLWSAADDGEEGSGSVALKEEPTGCTNVGDLCDDDTKYAGVHPVTGNKLYVIPCDSGQSWGGASCSGTRSYHYFNEHWSYSNYVTTDATSSSFGTYNTEILINTDSDTSGGVQEHNAAQTCADSTYGGYDDWYLPSPDEYDVLYAGYGSIGEFTTSEDYWTSLDTGAHATDAYDMSSGTTSTTTKNGGKYIRCMRGLDYNVLFGQGGEGCPNPGDRCDDDTIYLGTNADTGQDVFASPCDIGETWGGSSCSGTATLHTYNDGSSNYTDVDADSHSLGEYNTGVLLTSDANGSAGGDQDHDAALQCGNHSYGGYDDWYLPASYEMESLNVLGSGFSTHDYYYWSSTEYYADSDLGEGYSFWDDNWGTDYKDGDYYVRCFRANPLAFDGPAEAATSEPTGCSTIGDKCDQGLIYAFDSDYGAGNVKVYITDTAQGSMQWKASSGTDDIDDANNPGSDGWTSTYVGVDSADLPSLTAMYACATLSAHGYDDWYLPGHSELLEVWGNDTEINTYATDAVTGEHWSSKESHSTTARTFDVSTGSNSQVSKTETHQVRCIRREGITDFSSGGSGTAPTGCSTIGDACDSGFIYGGDYDYGSGNEKIYVTSTNQADGRGSTVGPKWGYQESVEDIPSDSDDGEINVGQLSPLSNYPAAAACDALTIHGTSDWYLPSQAELEELYANVTAINATADEAFYTDEYWSSNEHSGNPAQKVRTIDFSDGTSGNRVKGNDYSLRCVRRGNIPEAPEVSLSKNIEVAGKGVFIGVTTQGYAQTAKGVTVPDETFLTDSKCTSSDVGLLRYHAADKEIQVCDGSSWLTAGDAGESSSIPTGCPNVGDSCDDDTIYIGDNSASGAKMYTPPCMLGNTWSGSSCTHNDARYKWNDGSSDFTQTFVTSNNTGAANTASLITMDANSVTTGDQKHKAAQGCADHSFAGYDDWYLPTDNELDTFYATVGSISDVQTGRTWWTSQEGSADHNALEYNMSTGSSGLTTKNGGRYVRCFREVQSTVVADRVAVDDSEAFEDTYYMEFMFGPGAEYFNTDTDTPCAASNEGNMRIKSRTRYDLTNEYETLMQYCNGTNWVNLNGVASDGAPTMLVQPSVVNLVVNQPGDPTATSDWEWVELINPGPTSFTYWQVLHWSSPEEESLVEVDDSDCSGTIAAGDKCIIGFRAKTDTPSRDTIMYQVAGTTLATIIHLNIVADPLDICQPGMPGPGGHYVGCSPNKIIVTNKGDCPNDMTEATCNPGDDDQDMQALTYVENVPNWTGYAGHNFMTMSTDGRAGSEFLYNAESEPLFYTGIFSCLFMSRDGYEDFHIPSRGESLFMGGENQETLLRNLAVNTDAPTTTQSGYDGAGYYENNIHNNQTEDMRDKNRFTCIRTFNSKW
jgi:hypothetical protein